MGELLIIPQSRYCNTLRQLPISRSQNKDDPMNKKYFVNILILVLLYSLPLKLSAQPHLHIERNLEALRLDGNQSWLSFYDGPSYKGYLWNNQGNLTLGTTEFNPNGQLKFVTNLAERMTIDHLGRVGVNTSLPLASLHINHDNEALRISGAQPYLNFVNGLGGNAGYLWNKDLFNFELGTSFGNTTGSLTIKTNDKLGVWIDPEGDVGIGASPAGFKLDVAGELEVDTGMTIHGGADWRWYEPAGFTFAPCSGAKILILDYNGAAIANINGCDGSYSETSDRNAKSNFRPWRQKGVLADLLKLEPRAYEMKHLAGSESFGLIAQDVIDLFPEVVSSRVDPDGQERFGITYSKISIINLKAIQEQQEIIEIQKSKIEDLEAQMEEVQSIISGLIKQQIVNKTTVSTN
jgi:hypothetical protein